jgi:hypothetical protein
VRAGARAALGAFGIFVVACIEGEKPTAPSAPQIVVHAVLDMGSRDQLVLVERTRSGIRTSLTNFVGGAEPVLDAEVTITTPNGEVLTAALEQPADSFAPRRGLYRLALDRYGATLVPGGTYSLLVRVPAAGEITGTTTLPVATSVAPAAAEPFDWERDSLRLTWPHVEGAAGYEVRIAMLDAHFETFADSSFAIAVHGSTFFDEPLFVPGLTTTVAVTAVDRNYYEYYRALSDPFAGAAPSRLRGGYGVFGSLVPLAIRTLNVRRAGE